MRKDFAKILCEEPRGGWRIKPKRREDSIADDEMPVRVKHAPLWKTKWFGEHLGPLKRFLRSRCGHRWDDVYSEISQACPKTSATMIHIYQHLWGYVARNCFTGNDGKIYTRREHTQAVVEVTSLTYLVYVDEDGYLRPAPVRSRRTHRHTVTPTKPTAVERDGKLFIRLGNTLYRVDVSAEQADKNPKWAHLHLPCGYYGYVITRLVHQPTA
jgi:hypothetical protein